MHRCENIHCLTFYSKPNGGYSERCGPFFSPQHAFLLVLCHPLAAGERERENRGGGGTYLLMVVELECTNSNRHQLLSRIFHLLPVVHVIIFVLFLSSFMLPSLTNSVNLNEHCTKDHQPQNIISNLYKFVEAGTIPVPYKGTAT